MQFDYYYRDNVSPAAKNRLPFTIKIPEQNVPQQESKNRAESREHHI